MLELQVIGSKITFKCPFRDTFCSILYKFSNKYFTFYLLLLLLLSLLVLLLLLFIFRGKSYHSHQPALGPPWFSPCVDQEDTPVSPHSGVMPGSLTKNHPVFPTRGSARDRFRIASGWAVSLLS